MRPLHLDYSDGQVFLQDGIIYYSPNCSRPVFLPRFEDDHSSPFQSPKLNIKDFKHPVWWTFLYGWMGFIPLSPSYISSPFATFCWMPRIEEFDLSVTSKFPDQVVTEKRYRMYFDDAQAWKKSEELLVEAAHKIRIWHKIDGSLPPLPSHFHFDKPHKSRAIAKKMITLSRDWFTIWMGFISYLIAQSKRLHANTGIFPSYENSPAESAHNATHVNCSEASTSATTFVDNVANQPSEVSTEFTKDVGNNQETFSPVPKWYRHLLEKFNYTEHWLDGLTTSPVCCFNTQTPRAGVIFRWSHEDKSRPPIEWFIIHHVPLFFVWSMVEEQLISRHPSLSYLTPPTELLQNALTLLFRTPDLPLAGLILQRYYRKEIEPIDNEAVQLLQLKYAPSFVLQFATNQFNDQRDQIKELDGTATDDIHSLRVTRVQEMQAAAEAAVALPFQSILEPKEFDDIGSLFNHWHEFMDNRKKRQNELKRTEGPIDKQRRESREKTRPIRGATMYTWQKVCSSGGKAVYMRVRVSRKWNESVYSNYRSHQKVYNPIENEWDMCSEFEFGEYSPKQSQYGSDDELDYGDDYDDDYNDNDNNRDGDYTVKGFEPSRAIVNNQSDDMLPMQIDAPEDVDSDAEGMRLNPKFSQNIISTLTYGYGYVSPMPGADIEPARIDWQTILKTLGFVNNLSQHAESQHEHNEISLFFTRMAGSPTEPLPADIYDLADVNHLALSQLFDFSSIFRSAEGLYVFFSPQSEASDWYLGVHSPIFALYICRLIVSNPTGHTLVTIAHRLLERGMEFRTVRRLARHESQQVTVSRPYKPASFRPSGYMFTIEDFEVSQLQCKAILMLPQGRAALLKGGIIGRIAREHLSIDGALEGPSVEVTLHRTGYITSAETPGYAFCDDELTEDEMAIICGTYSIYTRKFRLILLDKYFLIDYFSYAAYAGQESVKSWFPPPHVFDAHQSGLKFVEWTERDECWFLMLLEAIRNGKARPRTVKEWRTYIKGQKTSRVIYQNNQTRSQSFLNQKLSIQT